MKITAVYLTTVEFLWIYYLVSWFNKGEK